MSIESDIFQRYVPDLELIVDYGFTKKKSKYVYEQLFKDGEFKAVIELTKSGEITGNVIDMENNDEFLPLRAVEQTGAFVGEVRSEYEKILTDIRDKCFNKNYFIFPQTNRISNKMIVKYNDNPAFMWEKFPGYGVFKNKSNNKWYAMIGDIKRSKLAKSEAEETIEIINLKLNADEIQSLLKERGFYPAYHMNKKTWITITLDETLADDKILELVEQSHSFTVKQK